MKQILFGVKCRIMVDAVKRVEQGNVALDDQKLAEIEDQISAALQKRKVVNARLRKLRKHRALINERRHISDAMV